MTESEGHEFHVTFSANHDNPERISATGLTQARVESAIEAEIRRNGAPAPGDWRRGEWPTLILDGIVIEYRVFRRTETGDVYVGSYRPVGYDESTFEP